MRGSVIGMLILATTDACVALGAGKQHTPSVRVFALQTMWNFRLLALCLAVTTGATLPVAGAPKLPDAATRAAQAQDCEWSRMKDGFGAEVVITPDSRWKARRGALLHEMPKPARLNSLRVGGKVWALIFLTNPLPDTEGGVNVSCDVRTVRPNGKVTLHRGVCALRRKDAGRKSHIYLAEFVVTMLGEEKDPLGEWVLEFVVRDRNRGVEVPIVGRYTLLSRDGRVASVEEGCRRSGVRSDGVLTE